MRTRLWCLIVVSGVLTCAGAVSAENIVRGETGAALDRTVTEGWLGQFWGAVLVARDGEIVLSKGYGLADLKTTPNDADMLFDIGSIAKQFTAAAILRLEMDGTLSTSDPAVDHLGDLLRVVRPQASRITIHHLLTHTSGIPRGVDFNGVDINSKASVVQRALETPLTSDPGAAHSYSNVNYFLLAAIIEEASGERFESYLKEHVFEPAGLRATGFVGDADLDRSKATARVRDMAAPRHATALDYSWNWGNRGATGVLTSAMDLYRWDRALRGDAVLSAEARAKMFAPGVGGYAYGWSIKETPAGTQVASHGGSTMGYRAFMTRYLEDDAVIIILSNGETDVDWFTTQFTEILLPGYAPTLQASLRIEGYERNEFGVVEVSEPEFEAGPEALLVRDASTDQVVVEAALSSAAAWVVAGELETMLDERADQIPSGTGMEVVLATMPYVVGEDGVIGLPGSVRLKVLPEYVGADAQGNRQVDPRLTLVILDSENYCWPLIAKMDVETARGLLAQLRGTDEPAAAAGPREALEGIELAGSGSVLGGSSTIELGEMPTTARASVTVEVVNAGDEAIRLLDAKCCCGCSVEEAVRGVTVQPGGSFVLGVELKAGVKSGEKAKRIDILLEGLEPTSVTLSWKAKAYVTAHPEDLTPTVPKRNKVVVRSKDGEAFRITGVKPAAGTFESGAKTKHEVFLDWDAWRESGSRRLVTIEVDHPRCRQVVVEVKGGRSGE